MKYMFLLALLCLNGLASASNHGIYGLHIYGPAPLAHDGRVVDTIEVAQAKAAHLSAYNAIAHGNYAPLFAAGYGNPYYYGGAPLAADGRVVDTPEVAHAKAAHIAAYNAIANGVYAAGYTNAYHYGPAPLGPDGRVVDTPEVAHAKAAHFAAYNAALHGNNDHGAVVPVYAANYGSAHYYGPAPLAADGRVVDTPEVAYAKAAHFAAHREALQRTTVPIYGAGVKLTPDGHFLQETPAVAHARAAHLAAYAAVANGAVAQVGWVNAPAHVQFTHDGQFLRETPEVALARAEHVAAYNALQTKSYGPVYAQYYQW